MIKLCFFFFTESSKENTKKRRGIKRRENEEDGITDAILQASDVLKKIQNKTEPKEDNAGIFGRLIANKIRHLTKKNERIAMAKVLEIIDDLEEQQDNDNICVYTIAGTDIE
jgi:hypothetical protein